jgi:hypothetical protein
MTVRVMVFNFNLFLGFLNNIVYICPMNSLKVDITKLCTQNEYAKLIGKHRSRVNQMIKAGELNTVKIKGATLVILQ